MSDQPRYLPRHVDDPLRDALASNPAVILDGPRGVGKTTTALRLAASVIMLPRDLAPLEGDAEGYLRSLPTPILIDEWQLVGIDLLWTIKRLIDEEPSPGRFILTGSVEPATYGPTYPLTGRAARLVMRPMTWAELSGVGSSDTWLARTLAGEIPPPTSGRPPEFTLGVLQRPGFPAARDLPDARMFLDAYAALVSQRAGDEGRDTTRLMRALRVLANLTGQAVPEQRVWEAADINKATWKQYEDLLARVHLSVPSPAFESNRLKRLTTYPKRFLSDTSLALALTELMIDDLTRDPSLAGPFVEAFVMQQLRPQVDLVGGSLFHLRTGAGEREVDAIVEVARGLVGIEVKSAARPSGRDVRQLTWLRGELGARFLHGFVVHTGGDVYPLGEGITAVPVDIMAGTAGVLSPAG